MFERNQMKTMPYQLKIEYFDGLYGFDRKGEDDRSESSGAVDRVAKDFGTNDIAGTLKYRSQSYLIYLERELKKPKVKKLGRSKRTIQEN